jgi:bile acid:Na+ symporter, BASS family
MQVIQAILGVLMSGLIVALGFSQGLAWRVEDLGQGVRHPAFKKGLLVSLVVVPLLAVFVAKVLPLQRIPAGVIALFAFCPGLPMALNAVSQQKGNRVLAFALSVTLSLIAILLMPLSLSILERLFPYSIQAPSYAALFRRVIVPFLGPFLLGMGLQKLSPRWAGWLEKPVKVFFYVALMSSTLMVVFASLPFLKHLHVWNFVAMLLVTLGSAIIGHVAGGPRFEDRTTLAFSAALGNPAFAFCLGGSTYSMKTLLGVIGLYLLMRAAALVPYQLWNARHRRQERGGGPSLPAGRRAHAGA